MLPHITGYGSMEPTDTQHRYVNKAGFGGHPTTLQRVLQFPLSVEYIKSAYHICNGDS